MQTFLECELESERVKEAADGRYGEKRDREVSRDHGIAEDVSGMVRQVELDAEDHHLTAENTILHREVSSMGEELRETSRTSGERIVSI